MVKRGGREREKSEKRKEGRAFTGRRTQRISIHR